MTDSTTTTMAADNGGTTKADKEHPVAVLRREEGRGVISLACEGIHATNDLSWWVLLKGVRSSPVEARKPPSRPGRYCIRRSRVLTSTVSWARLRLARLARDRLSCDQICSTGFSSCAYGGSWKTVSQSRAAISSAIAALTWQFRLSHTTTSGPASCWCAASKRWA